MFWRSNQIAASGVFGIQINFGFQNLEPENAFDFQFIFKIPSASWKRREQSSERFTPETLRPKPFRLVSEFAILEPKGFGTGSTRRVLMTQTHFELLSLNGSNDYKSFE